MRYLKNFSIIILVFILVLLDVSFFSNFQLYDATVLSTIAFILVFCIADIHMRYLNIFALSAIFFFSIFSSLPIFIILVNFLVLPLALKIARGRYFPEPTVIMAIFYSLLFSFCFETVMILYDRIWSKEAILSLFCFTVLNTFASVVVYAVFLTMRKVVRPREIKF